MFIYFFLGMLAVLGVKVLYLAILGDLDEYCYLSLLPDLYV